MVRLSSLGDVVHTLSALEALRRLQPSAQISWIVEPPGDELLSGHPALDEVIPFPRKAWQRELTRPARAIGALARAIPAMRRLSSRGFDIAVDFQGNFRSGVVTLASGASVRVGFARPQCRELNSVFTNVRMKVQPAQHRADKALGLVGFFGPVAKDVRVRLPRSLTAEIKMAHWLKSLPEGRFSVVMHPGTSPFGSFKRWPSRSFGELARRLIGNLGARVIVSWGPGEENMAVDVWETSGQSVLLTPPPVNLADLIALVRKCDLFVGADTGPTHIAAAAGAPTVAIFGPKDPAVYAPRFDIGEVVRAPVPCSPCARRRCDKPDCMTQITTEMVYEAAVKCLAARAPVPQDR